MPLHFIKGAVTIDDKYLVFIKTKIGCLNIVELFVNYHGANDKNNGGKELQHYKTAAQVAFLKPALILPLKHCNRLKFRKEKSRVTVCNNAY